jgi:hypothetical protein
VLDIAAFHIQKGEILFHPFRQRNYMIETAISFGYPVYLLMPPLKPVPKFFIPEPLQLILI